jgi:predicted RNA-binding Zn-ribbon protein involved in translation (DUF1610 family)
MSEIKLRRINSRKYCLKCGETVTIVMQGQSGHCPNCGNKIYTIKNIKSDIQSPIN